MNWPHHREVSAINGGDSSDTESFGCGDDRCVDAAEWQVAVGVNEFGNAEPVSNRHGFDAEIARYHVAQETHLGIGAQSCSYEVNHLSQHQYWHHEWTSMSQ